MTWRASALPNVSFNNGRYRAELTSNAGSPTMHYNRQQGRFDGAKTRFPFEVIVRNIGVEQLNSNSAPNSSNDSFVFAGVQVHVLDQNDATSAHVVVGHRGPHPFTVEAKSTRSGYSDVNDIGGYKINDTKADIRIVGNADRTLTVYWQAPNPSPDNGRDNWIAYQGSGRLPGSAPNFGNEVYVGLITYAYENYSLPIAGVADSFSIIEK